MINYQEMYDELDIKLKKLQNVSEELSQKKRLAEKEHDELLSKTIEQRANIRLLQNKRYSLPYSEYFNISVIVGIPVLVIFFLILGIDFFVMIKINPYLLALILKTKESIVLGSILLGGILLSGSSLLIYKVGKKVEERLQLRSFHKIINSDDYQKLVLEIERLNSELRLTEKETEIKLKNMQEIESKYQSLGEDIFRLETVMNYVENKINPQVELKSLNVLARRKINNSISRKNNNGEDIE